MRDRTIVDGRLLGGTLIGQNPERRFAVVRSRLKWRQSREKCGRQKDSACIGIEQYLGGIEELPGGGIVRTADFERIVSRTGNVGSGHEDMPHAYGLVDLRIEIVNA